jgi:hypothetical protein
MRPLRSDLILAGRLAWVGPEHLNAPPVWDHDICCLLFAQTFSVHATLSLYVLFASLRHQKSSKMEKSPTKSVSSLLIGMFSGMTDEYDQDSVHLGPLPFNIVLQGQTAASSASLFSLSSELLTAIISHIQPASLDNLALVNSHCGQLVRSRRFASIWLNFGPRSMQLLQWLCHEAKERSRHNRITKKPAIGSCVRRILSS